MPPTTRVTKLAARLALVLDDPYFAMAPTNQRVAPREWRKGQAVVEELRAYLVTGQWRYVPMYDRETFELAAEEDQERNNAVADWILSHDRFADLYSVSQLADKYLDLLCGYRPKLVGAGNPSVTHQLLAALCRLLDRAPWPDSQAERRPNGNPPAPFDPTLRKMLEDIEQHVQFPKPGPIALVQGDTGPWIRLPELLSLLEAIQLRPDGTRHRAGKAVLRELANELLPALDNAHDLYGHLCTLGLDPFEWMRRLSGEAEQDDIPTHSQIRKAAAFKRAHLEIARMNRWPFGDRRALEAAWKIHTVTKFKDDLDLFLESPLGKAAAGFTKRDTIIPMEEEGEDGKTRPLTDSIEDRDDESRRRRVQDSQTFRAHTEIAIQADILSAREAELFLAIVEGEMTLDELQAAFADLLPGQKPNMKRFEALIQQIGARLLPVIKQLEEQEAGHVN